jgi:hypothetical protein
MGGILGDLLQVLRGILILPVVVVVWWWVTHCLDFVEVGNMGRPQISRKWHPTGHGDEIVRRVLEDWRDCRVVELVKCPMMRRVAEVGTEKLRS